MKILAGIDIQKDFIDGAIGSEEAKAASKNMIMAIDQAIHKGYYIILTKDTHEAAKKYLKTMEGRKLPIPHCEEDTAGWQFPAEIILALADYDKVVVVNKNSFGSYDFINALWATENQIINADRGTLNEVYFCGLVTNICVISNALMAKAALPETPITILANACAGTTPEAHQHALEIMKDCQCDISEGGVE